MGKHYINRIFWVVVALLSAYYLYRGIKFRFFTEGNLSEKALWFYFHLATAIAPLVLGPFQFWTRLRLKSPSIHRTLGKLYLIGSVLGGVTALYLGITIDLEGSKVPLFLLSSTWLFMTIAAWITIRNKNIEGHRQFVIRSYALALVFVFLRLIGDIPQDRLFFFIASPEIRDTTLEWLSWIIPLLTIELIFSWIPLMRKKKRR
ncbi:DUF2306 domain-containing protein [Flagellimonas amoyensis]|uniref:DUF2306 domain-containing protein n=1 Tax=Flagellimonas amoyensis TaxID=2169401 RepID=UPI000D3419AD|nr:DUF2306 domain-containing protein [Allomuricauda amoyensis]